MLLRSITCLVVASLLAACTPYLYGVPQETWDRMSEPERVEAMRVYEREQLARRQAAEERARRQALEREQERARQAALERERRERIEAIHLGRGAYGELIRVRLQGGRIKIGDRHHHYQPLTFSIADGETRRIAVADYQGREVQLAVSYGGGALSLEGLRFPYDRRWSKGALYTDTGTSGPLALQGVDLFVEVHDRSSRMEREVPRLVIIREEAPVVIRDREPVRPQVRVVREKEGPKPPPVAEKEQRPAAPGVPPRPSGAASAERPPRTLEVVLLSWGWKVRGQQHSAEKAVLRISEGQSRELTLKAGAESRTVTLSYGKGELLVDATPGQGRDGTRFTFEKGWKKGKVYRFELKGKVPLERGELQVTGVD